MLVLFNADKQSCLSELLSMVQYISVHLSTRTAVSQIIAFLFVVDQYAFICNELEKTKVIIEYNEHQDGCHAGSKICFPYRSPVEDPWLSVGFVAQSSSYVKLRRGDIIPNETNCIEFYFNLIISRRRVHIRSFQYYATLVYMLSTSGVVLRTLHVTNMRRNQIVICLFPATW